ncbi:hypothetical protein D3C71_2092280 [compost metagenome]
MSWFFDAFATAEVQPQVTYGGAFGTPNLSQVFVVRFQTSLAPGSGAAATLLRIGLSFS